MKYYGQYHKRQLAIFAIIAFYGHGSYHTNIPTTYTISFKLLIINNIMSQLNLISSVNYSGTILALQLIKSKNGKPRTDRDI
jgi:hypothetical protein